MSKLKNRLKDRKNVDHRKYISRITKTLYYGKFPRPDGLSLPITELAVELFSESQKGRSIDRLHCDEAANISRNACVSPCSLVIAILYLERLKKICPEYLEKTASSDLFLVSLMVSCKFLYDDGETDEVFMDEWAACGGLTVKELIQLEKKFLQAIAWEVFVSDLSFWTKLNEIETILAKKEGSSRGFFTYTELQLLLTKIDLQHLIPNLMSVIIILLASYAVAVLTLYGSVVIVSHIPGACLNKKCAIEQNTIETKISQDIVPETVDDEIKARNDSSAINFVKTSIFLASIESFLRPYCNQTEKETSNVENVSWDWWTSPTMAWLNDISANLMEYAKMPQFEFFYFHDTYLQNKIIDLEDQIHKSTSRRIQDQLENSWHMEWTDTIKHTSYLDYYTQNVKS